jgi:hypothetical protein
MGEIRERMLRGELYIAEDAESAAEFGRIQDLLARVNGVAPGAWDDDVAPVTIGTACQIATRVQLLTATHPIDPEPRRIGWEHAEPISAAASAAAPTTGRWSC